MSSKRLGLLFVTSVVILIFLWSTRPMTPSVAELEGQIAGRHCTFSFAEGQCRAKSFGLMAWLLHEPAECERDAVECLGTLRTQEANRVLISVLARNTDVETCDGVIPIRSRAVSILGSSGDPSAIEPLRSLLASERRMRLSAGATGCEARQEPAAPIVEALEKLERR